MAKTFRLPREAPLLDIVSYGSSALHEDGGRRTSEQIEQIRRTVQRVPEVMVKVLPRASNDLAAAEKHLDYISRHGRLPLEMDSGDELESRTGKVVLEEWDLDIDDLRRQASLATANGRKPPKLVHKLMFSMPAGTPPDKVLNAVRKFAREQFWGQHRYAFVLHTDEDHPHVHLVLKAMSEQGERLNIRRATLREWRSEFARHLREQGIAANATERAVRGETRINKLDGIYRAALRGDSTHMRTRAQSAVTELLNNGLLSDSGMARIMETRLEVERGWRATAEILVARGHLELARTVRLFVTQMRVARTEREQLVHGVGRHLNASRAPQVPVSP